MAFDTFPCNPYPISKGMLEKGNNDELNTRVIALEGEVSDLNDTKSNQITIAPFFSAEASYEVGDLVYYNGLSYRCTNNHEGEWDADDFAATTIAGELDTLKSGLTSKQNKDFTLVGTIDVNGTINLNGYKEVYFIPQQSYVSPIIPVVNGGSCRYYVDDTNYISISIDANNIATLSANSAWANNCGVYAR